MPKALIYRFFVLFFAVLLVLTSCSEFRGIQRSDDWREKYNAAVRYYEAKDYYRANLLFEDIIPLIKGLEEGELAQFYNAYTYYHQRQYLLSSHYFKNFASVYSRSEYAEEASFMSAYSLYEQSPAYNLDESATEDAINALQSFINQNRTSKYLDQANDLIDKLQFKLEKKQFEISKQYLKVRKYLAAIESFQTFTEDYPDSRFVPEALFLKMKTQYLYANNSVSYRQLERYNEVIKQHDALISKYPENEFQKEASTIFSSSVEKIRKLKENNKT